MVAVESTQRLCDCGGRGELVVHDKGHLFPTKAVYTHQMMEFLAKHVGEKGDLATEREGKD